MQVFVRSSLLTVGVIVLATGCTDPTGMSRGHPAAVVGAQSDLVITPVGLLHRSCVHEVANGASISKTGVVTKLMDPHISFLRACSPRVQINSELNRSHPPTAATSKPDPTPRRGPMGTARSPRTGQFLRRRWRRIPGIRCTSPSPLCSRIPRSSFSRLLNTVQALQAAVISGWRHRGTVHPRARATTRQGFRSPLVTLCTGASSPATA